MKKRHKSASTDDDDIHDEDSDADDLSDFIAGDDEEVSVSTSGENEAATVFHQHQPEPFSLEIEPHFSLKFFNRKLGVLIIIIRSLLLDHYY